MADRTHGNHGPGAGGAGRWVFWGFVVVASYFLITEHRAHVFQYLPFLLVLACPLMHLFHGHGSHGGNGGQERDDTSSDTGKADGKKPDGAKKHSGGCH